MFNLTGIKKTNFVLLLLLFSFLLNSRGTVFRMTSSYFGKLIKAYAVKLEEVRQEAQVNN